MATPPHKRTRPPDEQVHRVARSLVRRGLEVVFEHAVVSLHMYIDIAMNDETPGATFSHSVEVDGETVAGCTIVIGDDGQLRIYDAADN